jgi:hypothetical protein
MRLSVIKYLESETIFYNPGVFKKDEDLIIFPFKEFDKFYNEMVHSLNVIKDMIKNSQASKTTNSPNLSHMEDWINLIQEDMDFLIKFDVQTTLNSFNNSIIRKIGPENDTNQITNLHKEKIQCLMGL